VGTAKISQKLTLLTPTEQLSVRPPERGSRLPSFSLWVPLDFMEIGSRQSIPSDFFGCCLTRSSYASRKGPSLFIPVDSRISSGASLEAKANLGTDWSGQRKLLLSYFGPRCFCFHLVFVSSLANVRLNLLPWPIFRPEEQTDASCEAAEDGGRVDRCCHTSQKQAINFGRVDEWRDTPV
jgi:hypothetical protein